MKPYLTDEEVREITEPLVQGKARCRFFARLGVKVEPKPNGQPLVLRVDFEGRPPVAPAANDAPRPVRDWTAFRERVASRGGPSAKRR